MKTLSITIALALLAGSAYGAPPYGWATHLTVNGAGITWSDGYNDYEPDGGTGTPYYTADGGNGDGTLNLNYQDGDNYTNWTLSLSSNGWTVLNTTDGDGMGNNGAGASLGSLTDGNGNSLGGGPGAPSGTNTSLIDNASIAIAATVAAAILVFGGALGWPVALKVYHVAKRALGA